MRLFEKQPLPKSIILMPLLFFFLSSIFSGFKSQWITLYFLQWQRAIKICTAKRWISDILIPLKLFILMNSYKFMFRSSNMIHKWLRKMNQFSIFTMFLRSRESVSLSLFKNWNFYLSLNMETLFVLNYLDSYFFFMFVIEGSDDLSKRTSSKATTNICKIRKGTCQWFGTCLRLTHQLLALNRYFHHHTIL